MKVKVYNIVFLQTQDVVQQMWNDLGGEDNVDMNDIIEYLMNWYDGYKSNYDSEIHDAEFLNTEFVGYAVFEDDDRVWQYLNPAKLMDYKSGYLFSANDSLGYYGLSYYELLPNGDIKSNPVDKSKQLMVYRNLNQDNWSVKQYINGKEKVTDHFDNLLLKDCTFRVREGGRQRVIKEKQKNVHAFIIGTYVSNQKLPKMKAYRITYNPYTDSFFHYENSRKALDHADYVYFNENGWALELLDKPSKIKSNPTDKQKYAIADWTYNWLFDEMEFDSFEDAWEFIDEHSEHDDAGELIDDIFVIPVKELKQIHKKTRLP